MEWSLNSQFTKWYVNQTTVTLSASSIYPNETLTVTTDSFSTVGSDTHAATDWKICSDSNGTTVVISDLNSSDKTSHIFAKNQLTAGTYYVFARHKGTALGYGEWSTGKTLTVTQSIVNTPSIIIPTDNAEVGVIEGITITTSAFDVTGGTDTHALTDYKICSDSGGNTTEVSALNSTDLITHTFAASGLSK